MSIEKKSASKHKLPLINSQESYRLHEDWWGKCRTCQYWDSSDRWEPGLCKNDKSIMFNEETWTEGHCEKWDSFDLETAIKIIQEDESKKK